MHHQGCRHTDGRRSCRVEGLTPVLGPVVPRLGHHLDLGRTDVVAAVFLRRNLLTVAVPLQMGGWVAAPRHAGDALFGAHGYACPLAVAV